MDVLKKTADWGKLLVVCDKSSKDCTNYCDEKKPHLPTAKCKMLRWCGDKGQFAKCMTAWRY